MALTIYYDGDCYFCDNYAEFVKLNNVVEGVELISLRSDDPRAKAIIDEGYKVNAEFVVDHDGIIRHGAEAFAYLNSLVEPRNWLSKTFRRFGSHVNVNRYLYPLLVSGRYLVLGIQGRPLIEAAPGSIARYADGEPIGVRFVRIAAFLLLMMSVLGIIVFPLISRTDLTVLFYLKQAGLIAAASYVTFLLFRTQEPAQAIYERVRYIDAKGLIVYALAWLVLVNIGSIILERRLLGLIGAFPFIGAMLELFMDARKDKRIPMLAAIYPLALSLIVFVPGWVFGPFYGGIAGWTLPVDKSEPVRISGVKLINDEGSEIWHSHAFLQPHTQVGRFQLAFLHGGQRDYDDYFEFLYANYSRIFPLLESGRLPHQWALGRLAYPTHNLSKSNALAYTDGFRPEEIKEIRYVAEWFDWDGNQVDSEIYHTYQVP